MVEEKEHRNQATHAWKLWLVLELFSPKCTKLLFVHSVNQHLMVIVWIQRNFPCDCVFTLSLFLFRKKMSQVWPVHSKPSEWTRHTKTATVSEKSVFSYLDIFVSVLRCETGFLRLLLDWCQRCRCIRRCCVVVVVVVITISSSLSSTSSSFELYATEYVHILAPCVYHFTLVVRSIFWYSFFLVYGTFCVSCSLSHSALHFSLK